jgi:hypothetical protein
MNSDEAIAAIRAELRPGGHPTATYLKMRANRLVSPDEGVALTNAILLNFEDRIVAIEDQLQRATEDE